MQWTAYTSCSYTIYILIFRVIVSCHLNRLYSLNRNDNRVYMGSVDSNWQPCPLVIFSILKCTLYCQTCFNAKLPLFRPPDNQQAKFARFTLLNFSWFAPILMVILKYYRNHLKIQWLLYYHSCLYLKIAFGFPFT